MENQNGRRSFLKYMFSLSAFFASSGLSSNKKKGFKIGKFNPKEAQAMGSSGKKFKKIGVEEHCFTEEYIDWLYSSRTDHVHGENAMFRERSPEHPLVLKALDRGEGRLKEMDKAGMDMQVLSLSIPDLDVFKTADAIALSKMVNDELSNTVKRYPDRFASFCCLPLQDLDAAADELERSVTKLGLVGAMVNTSADRKFSDQKYEVIYERLSRLNVPMYLHHGGSGEGIVTEVIQMVSSDLFDKYPGLQLILGHGGESVPFWLWRRKRSESVDGKKSFRQKFIEHFHITTSDQCWPALLQFLIAAVGADRIMFATDYPYESTKQHVDFIDSAPISDGDREKICHLNAEKLFKL